MKTEDGNSSQKAFSAFEFLFSWGKKKLQQTIIINIIAKQNINKAKEIEVRMG